MTAPLPYATAEGSLYELVARGNKDVYFFSDLSDSKFIFDNTYAAQRPSSFEIRRVPPRTAAEFGRTVDFDFDLVGDIMRAPTILINLPSWLPPQVAAQAQNSLITDTSGVAYGYTSGIAFFLFEQIQFYQDNILLQEMSGDALWALYKPNGTFGHSFVYNQVTGLNDNSLLSISRAGAPPQLRLELPLPGCQRHDDPGFPQRAATQHSYRLRLKLRRLEDLVEASDGRAKPQPWGRSDFQQTLGVGQEPVPFATLPRQNIPPLTLQLETKQIYVDRTHQDELAYAPQRVPFRRLRETVFQQNALDYTGVQNGGSSTVTRRLEGRHPAERILWFFRTQLALNANQLWKLYPGFSQLSFLIAGQSRELPRGPQVWRDVVNFGKEDLDTGEEFYTMNWGLGPTPENRWPGDQNPAGAPTGTVNFTTADRPTFYITLTAPPPAPAPPITELRVLVDAWAEFRTDGKGRADLLSAN